MTMVGNLCTTSIAWDAVPLWDGSAGPADRFVRYLGKNEPVLVLEEVQNGYVKVLCSGELGYVLSLILVKIEP